MSAERDLFEDDSFRDPINDLCVGALGRLATFYSREPAALEGGDILVETKNGLDQTYPRTVLRLFASVFDEIHEDMMQQTKVPNYLRGIVSRLVANSIELQLVAAGNGITQLLPSRQTLDAHVDTMWDFRAGNRTLNNGFNIFNFHFSGGQASVRFQPDQTYGSWSLGYGMEIHRTLLYSPR